MNERDPMPASYPAGAEHPVGRRRSSFSSAYRGLATHHADPPNIAVIERDRRRRVREDDSLRLIDDLTNRSLDPIYMDSSLGLYRRSAFEVWSMRVVCLVVCIAVGFLGSLFVRQLHTDPRREVRESLASELTASRQNVADLTDEVGDLRARIDRQSKRGDASESSKTVLADEMASGQVKVAGEGVTLTVADPLAASDGSSAASPRDSAGEHIRVVTDSDLQQLVSLLWRAGAEAIAVNGHRLGVQTSIRTAGGTILIGLDAVQSPYSIEAIGDRWTLADSIDREHLGGLYDTFREAGISLQVRHADEITLEAAVVGDVRYARKAE